RQLAAQLGGDEDECQPQQQLRRRIVRRHRVSISAPAELLPAQTAATLNVMARRYLVRAIALSLALHAVVLLALWLAPSWPWPNGASAIRAELVPWPAPLLPDDVAPVAGALGAAGARGDACEPRSAWHMAS